MGSRMEEVRLNTAGRTRLLLVLVELVTDFVEVVVGLRLFLKFFGASSRAPFVRWIYDTSAPLLAPFEGMFPSQGWEQGFNLEISALFALIVYSVVGYLIVELITSLGGVVRGSTGGERKDSN